MLAIVRTRFYPLAFFYPIPTELSALYAGIYSVRIFLLQRQFTAFTLRSGRKEFDANFLQTSKVNMISNHRIVMLEIKQHPAVNCVRFHLGIGALTGFQRVNTVRSGAPRRPIFENLRRTSDKGGLPFFPLFNRFVGASGAVAAWKSARGKNVASRVGGGSIFVFAANLSGAARGICFITSSRAFSGREIVRSFSSGSLEIEYF